MEELQAAACDGGGEGLFAMLGKFASVDNGDVSFVVRVSYLLEAIMVVADTQ